MTQPSVKFICLVKCRGIMVDPRGTYLLSNRRGAPCLLRSSTVQQKWTVCAHTHTHTHIQLHIDVGELAHTFSTQACLNTEDTYSVCLSYTYVHCYIWMCIFGLISSYFSTVVWASCVMESIIQLIL